MEKEQTSTIKLQRLESLKHTDNEVKDLLVGSAVASRISELEPFIMQLPSTLPILSD